MIFHSGKEKIHIFDWDGTLFDSVEIKKKNFCTIFIKTFNLSQDSSIIIDKIYDEFTGQPRKNLFNKVSDFFRLLNPDYKGFNNILIERNLKNLKYAQMFINSKKYISGLEKNNIPYYIVSSSPNQELIYLVNLIMPNKIFKHLKGVFGSDGDFTKGNAHFQLIMNLSGVNKNELVFYGDDNHDQKIANDFKIKFINATFLHNDRIQL